MSWDQLVPLGDVLVRSDEPAALSADVEYHEVTIKLWGKGVVSRGKVRGGDVVTNRRFVRAGQFILSKIDARNGAVGIVPPELDGAIVSNDFPSFTVRDAKRADSTFLGWLARSPGFVELCKAASEGTTNRVRIKESKFLRQEVLLPLLAEQQAVVARLDALAYKTRLLAAHLDAIEAEAKAFVVSLHHQLAGDRVMALSDVLELHEEQEAVRSDCEYPQVGVRSFGGGLFPKAPVEAAATTYRMFNTLYPEAIVLSQVKGWEGAIALTPYELVGRFASPEYRTFRCLEGKASATYLAELFKTPWFWSLLQDATRGVGARRERTRPEQFLNITLPMPGYADQLKALEVLSHLNTTKIHYAALREANAALLPATLQCVFA